MDKNNIEILGRYPDVNYVVVRIKDATYQPYVACWNFDNTDYTWGQGHYFSTLNQVKEYIQEKYDAIYEDVEMLEERYEIMDITDDKVLLKNKRLDGEPFWAYYEINLDKHIPEDKCCRTKINGRYYHF